MQIERTFSIMQQANLIRYLHHVFCCKEIQFNLKYVSSDVNALVEAKFSTDITLTFLIT